jgi:hypothetical protein
LESGRCTGSRRTRWLSRSRFCLCNVDLARKPSLYAAAGVDEYWVIDLDGRRVVAHRAPRNEGYDEVVEVRAGGELVAAGLEIGAVGLDDLLRAAAA